MATPPKPREDYSKEVADLAKLRRVVGVDQRHNDKWKKATDKALESLITLLVQSPKTTETASKTTE